MSPTIRNTKFIGHTQRDVRRHNVMAILQLLRDHSPLSRTDIARQTGLTKATISALVNYFELIGIVKSAGVGESWNGPKPKLLELSGNYCYMIGVDLSDVNYKIGLVNLAGELQAPPRTGAYQQGTDFLPSILPDIDQVYNEALQAGFNVAGIGVAISGLVDPQNGVVADSTVFGISDVPLQAELERKYHIPVRIDGDVHARLLTERRQAGPELAGSNVIYLYVGTGIGASLFMDGRIYRGSGGFAGEAGHIPVNDDTLCACGHKGCLEAVASWTQLPKYMPAVTQTHLTSDEVAQMAIQGNPAARQACNQLVTYLGKGIATLVTVLNPDTIIIGGDVSRYPELFKEPLVSTIKQYGLPTATQQIALRFASVTDNAGVIGAAGLLVPVAFSNCIPPSSTL